MPTTKFRGVTISGDREADKTSGQGAGTVGGGKGSFMSVADLLGPTLGDGFTGVHFIISLSSFICVTYTHVCAVS